MNYKKTPSFVTPYRKNNWTKSSQNMSNGKKLSPAKKIDSAKKEIAKDANNSNGMSKAAELVKVLSTPTEVLALKAAIGALDNLGKSLANHSSNILPYFYQNSTSDVDSTKVYIIRFNVGRLPTNSVRSAESIQGFVKL